MREQNDFLTALKLGHTVTKACQMASVSRRRVYYFRQEFPEFEEAWDDALAASKEELEEHLRSRALDKDDRSGHLLLMFLLKKLDPSYRDSFKTETAKEIVKTQEFEFSEKEVDQALEILKVRKAAQAQQQTDKATDPPADAAE